ncbi:tRNA dihydrouridine synthase [Thermophilibacter provencensis]|uniref:tRNA-dihydrouridine synthase n=1 Tax=Thermophilibacter provencensis TaxID=1852386 RepID=A0ABT7V308_9ACTN|nr:tRNA-dihydrouridine synthase [Thermophilibacter provencensis]MDM8270384.1 tRNA-dihydrouridine synthase [Thermophilibacter provencensis]
MTAAEVLSEFAADAALSSDLSPWGGKFSGKLLMAPMAGVSDAAYRLMARAGGAALAYSEMVSCAGLHYGEKSWGLVDPDPAEPDIAVQLFGSKPELFRESAQRVSERLGERLALLDINMACPVPKVTKKGEGSALLEDPELAAKIVRACREGAPDARVTVKIRRGRYMGQEVAPEFARAMEDAGACAIAVHGRFATQMYHGEADWGVIDRVADAVSVPVIASGDILSHDAAQRALSQTGASAVMVARGTYGNPWVFSGHEPTAAERIAAFECHVRLLEATGAHLKRARSLAGWYFKGMPDAACWRNAAMSCVTAEEFLAVAASVRASVQNVQNAPGTEWTC